jgi:CRP-like cAMP-binding protein
LSLKPTQFQRGQTIVRKGDVADEIFFIVGGTAEVFDDREGRVFAEFHAGSFFGEIGILFQMKRIASVRASSPIITVFRLSKSDFDRVLSKYPQLNDKITVEAKRRLEYNQIREKVRLSKRSEIVTDPEVVRETLKLVIFVDLLYIYCTDSFKKMYLFQDIPQEVLYQLALSMKLKIYEANEPIIRKDENGSSIFFVADGKAQVISDDGNSVYGDLLPNSFFGEIALFFDTKRTASVVASTVCTVLELEKESLDIIMNHDKAIKEKILQQAEGNHQLVISRKNTVLQSKNNGFEDFDKEKTIANLKKVCD